MLLILAAITVLLWILNFHLAATAVGSLLAVVLVVKIAYRGIRSGRKAR